jgi:hypothetical protein
MPYTARKVLPDDLRRQFKLKSFNEKNTLLQKHPHLKKFLDGKGIDFSKIREHSAKILSASAIAGALLFLPPGETTKYLPTPQEILGNMNNDDSNTNAVSGKDVIIKTFKSVLPVNPRPLDRTEEKLLEQVFGQVLGVTTKATLEGEHLNTTYGFIGAEQHLRRYPGDTINLHGGVDEQSEGIAPGLGAWGYFSDSKDTLAPEEIENEKWYAVVQTLYLPDWNKRLIYLRDWYKYRKVLIVNTENGNAVVADIADSGPAAWTGKQFGGSPEVMDYLGGKTFKKGKVIIFFVDDPNNRVKLGPVEYK